MLYSVHINYTFFKFATYNFTVQITAFFIYFRIRLLCMNTCLLLIDYTLKNTLKFMSGHYIYIYTSLCDINFISLSFFLIKGTVKIMNYEKLFKNKECFDILNIYVIHL